MAARTQQPTLDYADIDLLRRRVVNVVGHELRTPLSVLRGLAEQLQGADPQVVQDELAPALLRAARRAERLLDDLLLSAGITTALPVGDPVPVDIPTAIEQAWTALEPTAVDSVELSVELPASGKRPVALGHPDAIRHIFTHVLDNEAKYGSGRVQVRVEESDGSVRIVVPAPGFRSSGDETRLAFEPLFRGEHGVTSAPGIGVGLSTARTLARHDSGDITIDDTEGSVRVVVTLPTV